MPIPVCVHPILRFGIAVVSETALGESASNGEIKKGLFALALIIIVPVLIALFFLLRFLYKQTVGKKLRKTADEGHRDEAERYEKDGQFVSAAQVYEKKLKNRLKAASLYEKGGDYHQAALLYNLLGMTGKAKEMYERDGSHEEAAEVAMLEGEFDEAAALYEKAGRKIDAAKVMRQTGKTIYAVKAYRESGEYRKAAMLLDEEGMPKEAAEMFAFYLYDKQPDESNLDDFYTYALLLQKAEQVQKAMDVLSQIYQAAPMFKDVKERLLSSGTEREEEEVPAGKTLLRNFMRSGRMAPAHSLKLWVQVLKSLQQAYRGGWSFGFLSPDNIAIDSGNNVSFLKRTQPAVYVPPETLKRAELDERSDIYSAGVILFEMLTGGLEGLGFVRAGAIAEDVPEWLDEIVIRCVKKVREDRYRSIQEIFGDLKVLSREKKD